MASHGRSRSSRIRAGSYAGQRPVGTDEGVLGGLLGVARIAEHAQGDRIEPVLVGQHEGLERSVEVLGEGGDERAVGIHRSPEPGAAANRCAGPAGDDVTVPGRHPSGALAMRQSGARWLSTTASTT